MLLQRSKLRRPSRREVGYRQAIREGNTIDLPDNIPDFILVYLNELNCDRLENEPSNPIS
ncbi:hypothetical protein [Nostoc favosum]|uniref:Uncharacterized protein n=1 Tax=Nostoc favosum CHAB5714 TaxID=2780399 RepID=A0ABS8I9Z2_9NOSO|nr:hypothetical protein [Nostoc favosum]MCC5601017.1 hypothetical protein [Nostoc favosum CHAB5714]